MIGELLRIGDKVVIEIPKENREWGFNPVPDGTVAEITGFSEIHYGRLNNFGRESGVYENRSWVDLKLDSGETLNLSTCFVELQDKEQLNARKKIRKALMDQDPDFLSKEKTRLRDLPDTIFWEGDFVKFRPGSKLATDHPEGLQIVGINYEYIGQICDDGVTPMPLYRVSEGLKGGWHMSVGELDLVFVERGPVWKLAHDEPVEFDSLEDEANLANMMGRTKELRNPKSGLYSWTKDEVLAAIADGYAHGFSVSSGGLFVPNTLNHSAVLFADEDLGRRVAAATLEGFNNT